VWTGDGTLEGDADMTFDGDTLTVTGGVSVPATALGGQLGFFLEDSDNGTNYVGIGSPAANANDLILLLPTADPTAGQRLSFAVPSSVTFSDGVARDATQGSWSGPGYESGSEVDFYGTVLNPQGVYDNDSTNHAVSFVVNTPAAFTITAIYISCDADPTTEPTITFQHKAAGVGYGSPTTIEAVTTTAGVASITSGIDDATIPANTKLFFTLSDPDDALNEITWQIKGDWD
jgi:hypothetical protein